MIKRQVKRKLRILEVQFLAQEGVHVSTALLVLLAMLAPRENDPRNSATDVKGWVSSCLSQWNITFLIFAGLIVRKASHYCDKYILKKHTQY